MSKYRIHNGHVGEQIGENFVNRTAPLGFFLLAGIKATVKITEIEPKEIEVYKEALLSISKNSCCETCQEAKLVAEKALNKYSAPGQRVEGGFKPVCKIIGNKTDNPNLLGQECSD